MFKIARYIVRHKVGATALVALGVFFMTPSDDQSAARSSNPWSAQGSAQIVQADEEGMVDSMVDGAVEYLDEAGMNPVSKADETVERFDSTASAYAQANR